MGPCVPDLLAPVTAGIRALPGVPDPRGLTVVECEPQRGHWSALRSNLFVAGSVLGLLRSVYRARTRRVRSPPQTAHHGLDEAEPEGNRLTSTQQTKEIFVRKVVARGKVVRRCTGGPELDLPMLERCTGEV